MQTFENTPAYVMSACEAFAFGDDVINIKPCGNGHINHTFIVTIHGGKRYILQILNTQIFKDPQGVMSNILAVTNHIRSKLQAEGGDVERGTLTLVPTKAHANIYHHVDEDGRFWRAYDFVEGTVCRLMVDSLETFELVGHAFGDFQRLLSDFDASLLSESIPDFHHTPKRYAHLAATVDSDPVGRVASVKAEIAILTDRAEQCKTITNALAAGELPLRVTHNDTKLSNILLDDQTNACVCIIDLDTIMPGSVLYDVGDALRSGASTAMEDEEDLAKVQFRTDMFEAFVRGFVRGMGHDMTQTEKNMLPMGAWTIIYEQAVRFLDDYLAGDTYYHVDYPLHNLVRAKNQIQLLLDLERQMSHLTEFVQTL